MTDDSHAEFVLESREHLQVVERSLLALERAHDAQQVCECVDASLRAIHSLKGNAGFLGFQTVQQLAHATESVLENYRSLPVAPPEAVVEIILLANDRLAALVDDLEHSQKQDISGLLQKLHVIETGATSVSDARVSTTFQLKLSLPHPPATIVPFFESLFTLGSLSEVQLTEHDLRTSVEHWPHASSPLACHLQTDCTVIELQRQLSRLGQSVSWLELGAIELDDFDLARLDQIFPSESLTETKSKSNLVGSSIFKVPSPSYSGESILKVPSPLYSGERDRVRGGISQAPAPSPQPSPPGIPGETERDLLAPEANKTGELVYEPTNLLEGVPRKPILWLAQAGTGVVSGPIEELSVVDAKAELDNCLPGSLSTPLAVPEISAAIESISHLAIPQAPLSTTTSPNVASDLVAESSHKHREVVSTGLADKLASQVASEKPNSLRIQVDLLDRLMNLVSELTLVRNQSILAFGDSDGAPQAVIQRLNTVTSELQDAVLKTRMQPVGNLFGRFPRMVRDLARQLGKQVELILVGQEVELDKTVLEQLSDPLTHLIRNSIDHGLETPDDRLRLGKSVAGQVTLSAMAADGQVIIEIRDDGRGIDPEAVRAKVLARGLKTEAELQKISSKELYSFILLPGFSTAKQVSDVSGRGVGMDVVKTNVERLEGSLTIDSSQGLGTTMTLRVPLTLAIIPCLIVTVGNERFAVPQRGLEEIVCLHPGGQGGIEHSYDTELFRLRDVLLPIVRLNSVLHYNSPFTAKTKAEIMAAHAPANRDPNLIEYILVLRTGGRKFGLLVDDVRGTEEVVVKPMHPSLKKIGIFAGATLMGDGRVALIANIDGIAEHACCYGVEPPRTTKSMKRDPAEIHRILLFEYGPKEQFALPLVQVRRIESIAMDRVEMVGDQAFITIDGTATRIVQLDKYLNVSACEILSSMYLLLPKFVAEPMGILVSRIVDTESLSIALQETSIAEPGILGTALVRGRLSLFLDTQYLRERLFGLRSKDREAVAKQPSHTAIAENHSLEKIRRRSDQHVLLVDDTPFFREVVKRYFQREGLTVTTAVDGHDALQKLSEDEFDLVVSDIEMPNMDGWEFCTQARALGYTTPFLALTSLSKLEHAATASECGFDGFEEKLDHDRLIGSVFSLLGRERQEVSGG